MAFVMRFSLPITTGNGAAGVHDPLGMACCNENPDAAFVHDRTTLFPLRAIFSRGSTTMLNTIVPDAKTFPSTAIWYAVPITQLNGIRLVMLPPLSLSLAIAIRPATLAPL